MSPSSPHRSTLDFVPNKVHIAVLFPFSWRCISTHSETWEKQFKSYLKSNTTYCIKGYKCFQPSMNSLFLFISSFLEIHFCLITVLWPFAPTLWNHHKTLYRWSSSFSPFISQFDVTMNGTCTIITAWEGEIPMNCFCVCGVELHFLSPSRCVLLEMSELIGVAGKCEVCFPPPLSPPPPPPPL